MSLAARMRIAYGGFTLAELAIVLFVIVLLLGGLLVPLRAQLDARNLAEAQRSLGDVREALLGFVAARGYFPCPAKSSADGTENREAGQCKAGYAGFLPWVTLGTSRSDPWQHIWGYSVTPAFAKNLSFSLATNGSIRIQTRNSAGALTDLASQNAVAAAVVSYGRNGFGATSEDGGSVANSSSGNKNEDEKTNIAIGSTLVSREQSQNVDAPGGEFDDILTWVPVAVVFNRMIAAGRLP